jgi:hypothetical protein
VVPITPADVERQRLTPSDGSWDTRTVAASYRRDSDRVTSPPLMHGFTGSADERKIAARMPIRNGAFRAASEARNRMATASLPCRHDQRSQCVPFAGTSAGMFTGRALRDTLAAHPP